jgi:hypothetical protein
MPIRQLLAAIRPHMTPSSYRNRVRSHAITSYLAVASAIRRSSEAVRHAACFCCQFHRIVPTSSRAKPTRMLMALLLILAFVLPNRPAGESAAALPQFRQAATGLQPWHDTGRDDFEREVAAESSEEEGDEDALPCATCELIEEVGTPPYVTDREQSRLLLPMGKRHRPKRAPPVV